jgi:hypothetical protein
MAKFQLKEVEVLDEMIVLKSLMDKDNYRYGAVQLYIQWLLRTGSFLSMLTIAHDTFRLCPGRLAAPARAIPPCQENRLISMDTIILPEVETPSLYLNRAGSRGRRQI